MVLPQSLEKQSQASRELIQKVSGERRQLASTTDMCYVSMLGLGALLPLLLGVVLWCRWRSWCWWRKRC